MHAGCSSWMFGFLGVRAFPLEHGTRLTCKTVCETLSPRIFMFFSPSLNYGKQCTYKNLQPPPLSCKTTRPRYSPSHSPTHSTHPKPTIPINPHPLHHKSPLTPITKKHPPKTHIRSVTPKNPTLNSPPTQKTQSSTHHLSQPLHVSRPHLFICGVNVNNISSCHVMIPS